MQAGCEVALRDAVVGLEQAQAEGLTGVHVAVGQDAEHETPMQAQRGEKGAEDAGRQLVHAGELVVGELMEVMSFHRAAPPRAVRADACARMLAG